MTYCDATGSFENDLFEKILDTEYRYDVPYKIDKEKREKVIRDYGLDLCIKDSDVVTFKASYDKDVEDTEPKYYAFFTWPENKPEGSDDWYETIHFHVWDGEDFKERYEKIVHTILECVIGIDVEKATELRGELMAERKKIEEQVEVLDGLILNSDMVSV